MLQHIVRFGVNFARRTSQGSFLNSLRVTKELPNLSLKNLSANNGCMRSYSTETNKPTVQVQHHKHEASYVQVEKDIASLQAKIRDAYNAGRYDDALAIGTHCRDVVKDHFGSNHPVYASTLCNIGLMYKNMGKLKEAIETYEAALEVYKSSVGEQHASFATTLHNLGSLYRSMSLDVKGMERINAMHRAEECFEESLKIRRAILEQGHPDIALSMCNLGILHWHNKKPEQAVQTLIQAKEMLEAKVGLDSPLTALAMNNLAYVYKESGKYPRAIDLYTQVVEIRQRTLGLEHSEVIMALHNLAEAYRASGNEEKALEIQNKIVEMFEPVEEDK